jgi:hypothetical protein
VDETAPALNIKADHFHDRQAAFKGGKFSQSILDKGFVWIHALARRRAGGRFASVHAGEYSMRTSLKIVAMIGAAACLLSVSACATTESVTKAQEAADQAMAAANSANAAASKAQGSADQAAAAAGQAGTSAQGVSDKLDTFIREECSESKKEAKQHSACGVGTGGVKG